MLTTPSYCLRSGNWVKFRLTIGFYQNFLTFLTEHEISFLAEMELDFTTIPSIYHGKGYSYNLLQYLANNVEDNSLIMNFLNYFITSIVKFKYSDGSPLVFTFYESANWQNANIDIFNTTTTTTTTTTILLLENFEIFGQTYII